MSGGWLCEMLFVLFGGGFEIVFELFEGYKVCVCSELFVDYFL